VGLHRLFNEGYGASQHYVDCVLNSYLLYIIMFLEYVQRKEKVSVYL
jgi:hypothetical protein